MPQFNDGTCRESRLGPLSAVGFALAGIVLAAWSFAVVAVFMVPAMLVAVASYRTNRWLESRKNSGAHGPLVIEGEYEVLNSGTDNGWPR